MAATCHGAQLQPRPAMSDALQRRFHQVPRHPLIVLDIQKSDQRAPFQSAPTLPGSKESFFQGLSAGQGTSSSPHRRLSPCWHRPRGSPPHCVHSYFILEVPADRALLFDISGSDFKESLLKLGGRCTTSPNLGLVLGRSFPRRQSQSLTASSSSTFCLAFFFSFAALARSWPGKRETVEATRLLALALVVRVHLLLHHLR